MVYQRKLSYKFCVIAMRIAMRITMRVDNQFK